MRGGYVVALLVGEDYGLVCMVTFVSFLFIFSISAWVEGYIFVSVISWTFTHMI